jgi:hypothetical protein
MPEDSKNNISEVQESENYKIKEEKKYFFKNRKIFFSDINFSDNKSSIIYPDIFF